MTSSKDSNSCNSKGIVGLYSHRCEKEGSLCLIDVLCTAAAKQQTQKTELASIKFRFLEMIVQNALKDERDGSTLSFADEPIGNPTKHSKICSLHFRREDFCRMFTALPGQEKLTLPRLMADDLGTCAFLTIQANDPEFGRIDRSPPTLSKRTRRMVRF